MYRWQKPPILPSAYASAQRSSKRRWRSIECRNSWFSSGLDAGALPLVDGSVEEADFFLGIVDDLSVTAVLAAAVLVTSGLPIFTLPPPGPAPRRDNWIGPEVRTRRA